MTRAYRNIYHARLNRPIHRSPMATRIIMDIPKDVKIQAFRDRINEARRKVGWPVLNKSKKPTN